MSNHNNIGEGAVRNLPRAHDWEVVSSFAMAMPKDQMNPKECMLEPAVQSLKTYGLEETLLREMCAAVAQTGEDLRQNCIGVEIGYVSVRVLVATQAMRASASGTWRYYVIKQMASSESDSLDGINDPRCYIDLHVYREV
jgi:hypothetical protein